MRQLQPNPDSGSLGTLYAADVNNKIFGYDLKRITVHSPSEHTIEGTSYDLEIQFEFDIKSEFSDVSRTQANLAIMYTTSTSGSTSNFIEMFMEVGDYTKNLNELISTDLPNPLVYFAYEGSKTIASCEEIVNWYVLEQALPMSKTQLDVFTTLWAGNQAFAEGRGNNREINESNSRIIKKGGIQCEEQFIYFFSFILLYAFINYFIFKLL